MRLSSSTLFVTEGSFQEPTSVDVCLILEDSYIVLKPLTASCDVKPHFRVDDYLRNSPAICT